MASFRRRKCRSRRQARYLLNVTADPVRKYLAAFKGLEENGHDRPLLLLAFLPGSRGSVPPSSANFPRSHPPSDGLLQKPCLFRFEMTLPVWTDGSRPIGVPAQGGGLAPSDGPVDHLSPHPRTPKEASKSGSSTRRAIRLAWTKTCRRARALVGCIPIVVIPHGVRPCRRDHGTSPLRTIPAIAGRDDCQ